MSDASVLEYENSDHLGGLNSRGDQRNNSSDDRRDLPATAVDTKRLDLQDLNDKKN